MDREASHPALLFYGRQAIQRVRCPLGPESIGDVNRQIQRLISPLISTSPPPRFLMPRESWSRSRRYSSTRVLLAPAATQAAPAPTNQAWSSCGGLSGQNHRISAVNHIRPKIETSVPGLSKPWVLRARRGLPLPRVDRWYRLRLSPHRCRHRAALAPRSVLMPCAHR
jgi:hypothetical protein